MFVKDKLKLTKKLIISNTIIAIALIYTVRDVKIT